MSEVISWSRRSCCQPHRTRHPHLAGDCDELNVKIRPNSRRLPWWLRVSPPRHLLGRQRTRRNFRRRLLMAKRGSAEWIARRLILLTPTKVHVNYPLIPSSVYSFDRLTVLKWLHPDVGISNMAMDVLDSFINDIFKRIAEALSRLFHPLTTLTCNILLELASY